MSLFSVLENQGYYVIGEIGVNYYDCLLYTSPSPRD